MVLFEFGRGDDEARWRMLDAAYRRMPADPDAITGRADSR